MITARVMTIAPALAIVIVVESCKNVMHIAIEWVASLTRSDLVNCSYRRPDATVLRDGLARRPGETA